MYLQVVSNGKWSIISKVLFYGRGAYFIRHTLLGVYTVQNTLLGVYVKFGIFEPIHMLDA